MFIIYFISNGDYSTRKIHGLKFSLIENNGRLQEKVMVLFGQKDGPWMVTPLDNPYLK